MKLLFKVSSFISMISFSFNAFADDSPTNFSNFSPRIRLQARYSFSDTYRQNQMDLIYGLMRFGLNYRYKNISGVIEVQNGNTSDPYNSSSPSANVGGITVSTPPTDNGQQSLFIARRANLGIDPYSSDPATITFYLGRDHLPGSRVYAPDALAVGVGTSSEGGALGEDGVSLKYAGKYEFGKIDALLGYYDNILFYIQGTGATWFNNIPVTAGDFVFGSAPKTQSRATEVILNAEVPIAEGNLETTFLYGMQPNAVTKVTSSTNYTARDVSNLEFSLGYNYKQSAFTPGIWFQSVYLGRTQTSIAGGTTNDFTYANASSTDDSQTINTIGIGFMGTSKLWGMSGPLAEDDVLTYGFGYQNATGQLVRGGGVIAGVDSGITQFTNKSLTTDMYNLAVGYQQGKMTFELNYILSNANCEIYTGTDGIQNKKSAGLIYLSSVLTMR